MPFCPNCRDEFQDWVGVCPDCRVKLVGKLKPVSKPLLPKLVKNKLPNEKLVTIARFSHPEEAYIIAARLESEGISSFVSDEFTATFNWAFTSAVGVVKLLVIESEMKEALRILSITKPDIQSTATVNETCPECNSSNVQYEVLHISPIYVMFLLVLFISFVAINNLVAGRLILPFTKRRCQTCGHQWKNRS